jgi:hypothetical protein
MNQKNGYGYRLYKNNKVYIGDFKDDLKHGQGKLLNRNGEILYEGEYSNDLMNGKGRLYLPNKYFYEGEFSDNHIKGKYIKTIFF